MTWPWNWPLEAILTSALGASTSPCQSTEPPIVNEVASGRFQAMCAASTPVRFSYWGATVRFVSVVTLMSAVAPGLVSVIVMPAAASSWAALTVNTLRPSPVPVSSSACEYGLRPTVAPGL